MNTIARYTINNRRQMGFIVFSILLLSFSYRFLANSWIHQLDQPVFRFPFVDLLYWFFHSIRLPEFLVQHQAIALLFDLGLLVSILGSIYNVNRRIFPILFSIFFLTYFITYNTFSMHHTHCMAGGLFVAIPFWFKSQKTFRLLWEGLRYYVCWIYGSAFLWKLLRGSLFSKTHAEAIIQDANVGYLVMNPDTALAELLRYAIAHPDLTYYLMLAGFFLQGSFLIGFFTKRWDKVFFVLPLLFHLATFILMEVVFFEILVLNLTFISLPLSPPADH